MEREISFFVGGSWRKEEDGNLKMQRHFSLTFENPPKFFVQYSGVLNHSGELLGERWLGFRRALKPNSWPEVHFRMASSPETSPPQNTNTSTTSSDTKADSSPPPKSSPSPPPPNLSPPPPKSPPPSSPPPSSPPPSSPPPSSPPPSSPPPSSPPPSSPPPSSPPPTSPSPPPKKDSPPPPPLPASNSSSSPSPPPPPGESTSPSPPPPPLPPSSSPPASNASPPPPSTSNSTPTPPAAFFPPPSAVVSPPGLKPLPPPPSSFRSPPHNSPSRGSDSSAPNSNSSSDSHEAIIAGVAVASVFFLAFVIVCLLCILRKKRKPYYMEPMQRPPPGGHGEYYQSTQQWNSPVDHIVKLPPPPGVMGTPAGGVPGWGAQPQAAHVPNHTSGEYSSGFSGPQQTPMQPLSPNMNLGFSKSQFSYDELASATSGFSQGNLLGQGGFGYVHKGVLPNGQEVAVKSLKSGSGQGEREFQAEVEIISRVHHRHLVSLVGYCIANDQRMLVYEFVPNSTLESHLYGKGWQVMDWATRLRIAVGSAKGLAYLHEDCHPKIIHRDIKAANILLDNNYEAMVADFGLAKLSSDNFTHVSTRVMGTFGYLAPEYASSGKLTEKSDVFSFGVMLLELITGRRPVDPTSKIMEDSLVDWSRPLLTKALEDGNYDELVDPRLEGNFVPQEMARMAAAASASIRHSARRRPKMSQIVRTLEGDHSSLDDLSGGGTKANESSAFGATQAYDTGAYNADMMKFRKMVMNSQEFTSSEFGGTSEYGLNPSSTSSDSRIQS